MSNRIPSSPNWCKIVLQKLRLNPSSPNNAKPNVACRLSLSQHSIVILLIRSVCLSFLFIVIFALTKVQLFAIITLTILLPSLVIWVYYILFISPIRLFKLSSIISMPKSLRNTFTTSKKSSCNSSCRSMIKPVSK